MKGLPDDAAGSCGEEVIEIFPKRAVGTHTWKFRERIPFPKSRFMKRVESTKATKARHILPVLH